MQCAKENAMGNFDHAKWNLLPFYLFPCVIQLLESTVSGLASSWYHRFNAWQGLGISSLSLTPRDYCPTISSWCTGSHLQVSVLS